MPLYREWSSDAYSLAAIWKIDEPEDFFQSKIEIISDIKNDKKRIEHLAGRFLLKYLKQDFPLLYIEPDEHDKPRLKNNEYYFSISHSYPYVAVVISPYEECGIDIQSWHPRMKTLQDKFLSEKEKQLFGDDEQLLTMAWSIKEAAYKWQGRRGVEFSDHLIIEEILQNKHDYDVRISLNINLPPMKIHAKAFMEKDFAFALIIKDGHLSINK